MKKILITLLGLAAFSVAGAHAQVIFSQNFSSGNSTSDYFNGTPTDGQWNSIATNNATVKVWSIESGTLQLASTGASSAAAYRTTSFSTVPTAFSMSFNFNLTSSSTALSQAFGLYFGSTVGAGATSPTNANINTRFFIGTTAANEWYVRDGASAGLASANQTTQQTVRLFSNSSGGSISYDNPISGSTTLATGQYDIWVGSVQAISGAAVTTPANAITQWKINSPNTGTFTGQFDDIVITAIPEPSTWALIGLGGAFVLWRLRRKGNA